MTCLTCTQWKSGPMAKHALRTCAHGTIYEYYPPSHSCNKHVQLEAEKLAARTAWHEKRGLM